MKTKTVERLMNETPEHTKQQVSEYADNLVTVKASTTQEPSIRVLTIFITLIKLNNILFGSPKKWSYIYSINKN
jgi:hypothetical protein